MIVNKIIFSVSKLLASVHSRVCSLISPGLLARIPANTIQSVSHHNFFEKYSVSMLQGQYPHTNCLIIRNAVFGYNSGAVWTSNDLSIFLESVGCLRSVLTWRGLRRDAFLTTKNLYELSDNYLVTSVPICGYYHFILEYLPTLVQILELSLLNNKKIKIIFPSDLPRFAKSFIDILSSKYLYSIYTAPPSNTAVSAAIFWPRPLPDSINLFLVKSMVKTLLDQVESSTRFENIYQVKKIYVSRKKSTQRSVSNEYLLENLFSSHGFSIIYAEEHTSSEQVSLFSKCSTIAGIHGSGLANMIYMQNPQASVIEVALDDYVNLCFRDLAQLMTLNYFRFNLKIDPHKRIILGSHLKYIETYLGSC